MRTQVVEVEVEGLIGDTGVTYTPSVSPEGVLSWTNDGDKPNPDPISIKGIPGQKGDPGTPGEPGEKGDPGEPGAIPSFTAQVTILPATETPEVIVTPTTEPLNVDLHFKLPVTGTTEIAALDSKITEETTNRIAAINTETLARTTADDALNTALTNAVNTLELTDETLQDNIDAEATAREEADEDILEKLADITKVADIIQTKADLDIYDTSKLNKDDIIIVIEDETHSSLLSYFRWDGSAFSYTSLDHKHTASSINLTSYVIPTGTLIRNVAPTDTIVTAFEKIQEHADINTSHIEVLEAASDVRDVTATKAALDTYDTSGLFENDIIKVLKDETQSDSITYYRWNGSAFSVIGSIGPYYTKSETDDLLTEIGADQISSLPGYAKPTTSSAITTADSLNSALGKLEKKVDDKTSALIKLTGYSKPTTTSAILATDSINIAIGKLEKQVEGISPTQGTLTGYTKATTISDIAATDTVLAAFGKLEKKLDPTGHQHPSSQINLLTGYTVSTAPSDLAATDTLNAALGKIQGYINEIRKACDDAD